MRNRRRIENGSDVQAEDLQGADGAVAAHARTLDADGDILESVGHGEFGGLRADDLGSVGGGLTGAAELVAASATPGDHVAVGVRDGDLGIIESGQDVADAGGDVLRALGATNLHFTEFFTKQFLGGDFLALRCGAFDRSSRRCGDFGRGGGSVGGRGLGLLHLGGLGGFFAHRKIMLVLKIFGLLGRRGGDADGLALALAGTGVGARTLSANREAAEVAETAVALNGLKALQVLGDVAA